MPQSCEFARLGVSDAEAMHRIEQECFSLPWSLEQCRVAFSQPSFAAFGLFARCGLTAYISFYHTPGEMEILNLAVLPEYRKRGLGRRLLEMVLQVARKMGIEKALLEVRRGNSPAIALYRSSGFELVGTRPRYYADTGEDALIFSIQKV